MEDQWFVGHNGQKSGPYTTAQLRQMAAAGQIAPGDMLWKQGLDAWVPMSNVAGLVPVDVAGPPPLGRPPEPGTAPAAGPTKTSGLAVASLVLGVLSCGLMIFTGIPAIVCGVMGLNRISRSERDPAGPRLTGQGMAITGLVLASLSTLLAPLLIAILLPAIQAARQAARRVHCMNQLQEIGAAMLRHEDTTGVLPAAITGADGTPLLSWRVAILPYIEQKSLYEQFHLDEPWDSEHNRSLIPLMPLVYACPSADMKPGRTTYLLLDGPGAAFEPKNLRAGAEGRIRGLQRLGIGNKSEFSIMVVEAPAGRAVEWTRPAELSLSPRAAAALADPKSGHGGGGILALHSDGQVLNLRPAAEPAADADPER
jgi:hypothetical protein